uniref:Uncharacterized protein n=1 Tax=Anguilla anguilla TaxID=7936 RepID=A0A0E9XUQ3_ANGAN
MSSFLSELFPKAMQPVLEDVLAQLPLTVVRKSLCFLRAKGEKSTSPIYLNKKI